MAWASMGRSDQTGTSFEGRIEPIEFADGLNLENEREESRRTPHFCVVGFCKNQVYGEVVYIQ